MTTHENFLPSDSQLSSPENEEISPPLVNPIADGNNIVKQGGTLKNRLLLTILPTVLIPLAVASFIGINFTQKQAKNNVLGNTQKSILLASESTQKFLKDAFGATDLLAANPVVIQSLYSGTAQAKSQGLLEQSIEQTEKDFAQTKLLKPDSSLNNYLQAIAKNKGIAEIILTERNGFNVAYSSPTSDFVQSDEQWWQTGAKEGKKLLEPEFDESTNTAVLELVNSIKDPNSNQLLAVTKIGVSVAELNKEILSSAGVELSETEKIQIIEAKSGKALNTASVEGAEELGEIIGGQTIVDVVKVLNQALTDTKENIAQVIPTLQQQTEISQINIEKSPIDAEQFILSFEHQGRFFDVMVIPNTDLIVVTSVEQQEIAAAGRNLSLTLGLTSTILALIAIVVIISLAKKLSQPLTNLTDKAQQVAAGNLDVQADLEGTQETQTLAENFNNLVQQVKDLIQGQEIVANQQRQEKEKLEQEIYTLLEEIQEAADGDLTVRASLDSMEMSTVADLFNAIIDSLQDIAVQVKSSSKQVSNSLVENKQSIQTLAEQAIQEAQETRNTLEEIEQMSHSIEEVANKADQASILANDAYEETREGSTAMDETVNSILSLRTTVGETASKMKRLGESSQKIAQIVSLIEEIALKTNLLAINASRAGDQGQGFSVFGEQLAQLGEQSAAATQQIAQIANDIKLETQEVTEAMEMGNSQAIDTTRVVESTKQRLEQVLDTSRHINELMQSISQATISQTDTSMLVTKLMQQIALQSEERSTSSQQVSQSMEVTAQVAQELEAAVEKFRVSEE